MLIIYILLQHLLHAIEQARYLQFHLESSGLSSKLRVKPNNTQPVDDGDPN